jgi:predicted amidophosphoribosyltransferase
MSGGAESPATLLREGRDHPMWLDQLIWALLIHSCPRCAEPCWEPPCAGCQSASPHSWQTPGGSQVLAVGPYSGPAGEHTRRLKYGEETVRATGLGRALGYFMPAPLRSLPLVPIPLHPERLAERGFNQSALLARGIRSLTKSHILYDALIRHRVTQAQAQLAPHERAQNLKGAFEARAIPGSGPVLLVDDVVTTGHTVDAARLALEAAGTTVAGVLCCALAEQSLHD